MRTSSVIPVFVLALHSACAQAVPPAAVSETETGRIMATQPLFPVTAMAPLVIGKLDAPYAPEWEHNWQEFRTDLDELKAIGVSAISLDIWWGAVEIQDQQFDWAWVDRMRDTILAAGLHWRPVLAFHRCGGNVGDNCQVPIPDWVWNTYLGENGVEHPRDLGYVSMQGNESREALSVWATAIVLEQYRDFMIAFRDRYSDVADQTEGIAIGLGSASELRYPSYNGHDQNAGYPTRGVLQCYSRLALQSFRKFAVDKYGDLAGINQAWGFSLPNEASIYPPGAQFIDGFYAKGEHHNTAYGRDFFDWYSGSLAEHGSAVLGSAIDVFNAPNSSFFGVKLQGRIPGVHWRMTDGRLAELSAGLIRTSSGDWDDSARGHGYGPIISVFRTLREEKPQANLHLEFTALEFPNGNDGPSAGSLAQSLVFWVGAQAHAQDVPIGGENALAGTLSQSESWDRIENALQWSYYESLTLLRTTDVLGPVARERVTSLIERFSKSTNATNTQ